LPAVADRRLEKQVRKEFPGLLHNLPGEKKKQILDFLRAQPSIASQEAAAAIVHQSITATSTSGPVPPAELLAGYNREVPDGANRLFTLVEQQSQHRQELENRIIETQNAVTVRGQWFAFVLVLLLTCVAAYFGYHGQDWLAGTIFTTTIAGVATVFLAGRHAQKRNLDAKAPR
jgi:uncharacterized membrane protein